MKTLKSFLSILSIIGIFCLGCFFALMIEFNSVIFIIGTIASAAFILLTIINRYLISKVA